MGSAISSSQLKAADLYFGLKSGFCRPENKSVPVIRFRCRGYVSRRSLRLRFFWLTDCWRDRKDDSSRCGKYCHSTLLGVGIIRLVYQVLDWRKQIRRENEG